MTLQPYSPEKLDALALRLLDLVAILREMSHHSREHQITDLTLHDRKVHEWCNRLEAWARRAQAELDVRIRIVRATRRAKQMAE